MCNFTKLLHSFLHAYTPLILLHTVRRLCCGIFRQLHCYWPLSGSLTHTPGFALIKMTSHSHIYILYAVGSVFLYLLDTAKHQVTHSSCRTEARNVLEVGQMFPHWLDETNFSWIGNVDMHWTTNTDCGGITAVVKVPGDWRKILFTYIKAAF